LLRLFKIVVLAAAACAAPAAPSASRASNSFDAAAGGAQSQGAPDRRGLPLNKTPLRLSLPRPRESALRNGLRVLLVEDHRAPSFTMQLVIPCGGLDDPRGRRGLSELTAEMLREGTARRTGKEIADELAAAGSTLFVTSDFSSTKTTLTLLGLTEYLDASLGLLADVALRPKFAQADLDRLKSQYAATLQSHRADLSFAALEVFSGAVYGAHPAALVAVPEDSLPKITSRDLVRFHAAHYRPDGAYLIVTGDLTLKQLMPKVGREFGAWKRVGAPEAATPTPRRKGREVYVVDRPGSPRAALRVGGLTMTRADADYFPFLVMNKILGADNTSRLALNLRAAKGLTYGVNSDFDARGYPGTWEVTTDISADAADKVLSALKGELAGMCENTVAADELESAKRSLVGSYALSLEDPLTVSANIATRLHYGLPADYWDTYPLRVNAVTAGDVRRVACKYLDWDYVQIVLVGDASKTASVLSKYGHLNLLDERLRPAPAGRPGSPE
jgi:zinc protease